VSLRLSPLAVGATLRMQDSLLEGRSRFYAEITRIRTLADIAAGAVPLLFLLDELSHGTNSHDRLLGAKGVLRSLLERVRARRHHVRLSNEAGASHEEQRSRADAGCGPGGRQPDVTSSPLSSSPPDIIAGARGLTRCNRSTCGPIRFRCRRRPLHHAEVGQIRRDLLRCATEPRVHVDDDALVDRRGPQQIGAAARGDEKIRTAAKRMRPEGPPIRAHRDAACSTRT
jgi:hypothetical protein